MRSFDIEYDSTRISTRASFAVPKNLVFVTRAIFSVQKSDPILSNNSGVNNE